jgi:hypothetical protein
MKSAILRVYIGLPENVEERYGVNALKNKQQQKHRDGDTLRVYPSLRWPSRAFAALR